LAQLEGTPLTRLGMGGREMKNQAEAYLKRAKEGALDAKLAAQNAALQAEIEKMREQLANVIERQPKPAAPQEEEPAPREIVDMSYDDLRAFIKEKTGTAVKGRPAKTTLVAMAEEASAR
jgi:regulator of replication initiation timing